MQTIIKVYKKQDAPEGAIFLSEKIERNGLIDLFIRGYNLLMPNEKMVYLYLLPIKK
jgi:hypothetical protein